MADTTYEVVIVKTRENDGGAYLRKGGEGQTEVLPMHTARETMGEDRVIGMLLNAIETVRRTHTK